MSLFDELRTSVERYEERTTSQDMYFWRGAVTALVLADRYDDAIRIAKLLAINMFLTVEVQ